MSLQGKKLSDCTSLVRTVSITKPVHTHRYTHTHKYLSISIHTPKQSCMHEHSKLNVTPHTISQCSCIISLCPHSEVC